MKVLQELFRLEKERGKGKKKSLMFGELSICVREFEYCIRPEETSPH